MQHFWYEANLDHKDTQCAVLGDVQLPALHIFNNFLCFQLWVHVGLRELSLRIVEFDSDRLKASLHSEEAPPSIPSKEFPHLEVSSHTNHFLQEQKSICFALFAMVPFLRGQFINFLAGHTTVNADKIATTKSA